MNTDTLVENDRASAENSKHSNLHYRMNKCLKRVVAMVNEVLGDKILSASLDNFDCT